MLNAVKVFCEAAAELAARLRRFSNPSGNRVASWHRVRMEGLPQTLACVLRTCVPRVEQTATRGDKHGQRYILTVGLQTYRKKRKFDVTPEPRGRAARAQGKSVRHPEARGAAPALRPAARARRRDEELGGDPRPEPCPRREAPCGPRRGPSDRVQRFEGTIPQGEYGGGTVMIWDRGHWLPEGDPHKRLQARAISIFTLEGEKLHGRWHLVRMRGRPGEKQGTVAADQGQGRRSARERDDPDILEEKPLSVVSGRSIAGNRRGQGPQARLAFEPERQGERQGRRDQGARICAPREHAQDVAKARAQSASPRAKTKTAAETSSKANESGNRKARRCRTSCRRRSPPCAPRRRAARAGCTRSSSTAIASRRGLTTARCGCSRARVSTGPSKFPNVAAAVAEAAGATTALIDGEIVVEDARGVSSFSGLQAALKAGERDRFLYYVFDLLHLDGRDLTGLPLDRAQGRIGRRLRRQGATGHHQIQRAFRGSGPDDAAARLRAGARRNRIQARGCALPHRSRRTRSSRPSARTPRNSWSAAIRAVERSCRGRSVRWSSGYYDQGRFIYAGRIGTGYTQTVARDLWKRLHPPGDRQAAVRSNSPRGSPPAGRELGRAQNGDRVAIPRVDR